MKQSADIDVLWGGYYVIQEEGSEEFGVFRLLDFNRDAYHAALFSETFREIPSLAEIRDMAPFVGHVPIDTRNLLTATVHLVGGKPLMSEDLDGYLTFLDHHQVPADVQTELLERIIGFSSDPPLRLRLELEGEELVISERSPDQATG